MDWLGQQVAARPQDANFLAVYAAERGHLAKLAGQMVSAKLDEQRQVLDETAVEKLELALVGILRDLGHDPASEYVRRVVTQHLREVPRIRSAGVDPEPRVLHAVQEVEVAQPVPF